MKNKPTPWIVNLGDLKDPPYPTGTLVDVIRRDGNGVNRLPFDEMVWVAMQPDAVHTEWQAGAILLYRRHSPKPKPKARHRVKPAVRHEPPVPIVTLKPTPPLEVKPGDRVTFGDRDDHVEVSAIIREVLTDIDRRLPDPPAPDTTDRDRAVRNGVILLAVLIVAIVAALLFYR